MIFIFLPPNNLEFLEFRIPYENTARNSKIPYRDPRVKLGDDRKRDPPKGRGMTQNTQGGLFIEIASLRSQ